MSNMTRAKRKFSNHADSSRRGTFETLEPRLDLSANLGFAGAFDIIGGSTGGIYTSSGHNQNYGGGLVTDAAGNRYVTINGAFHSGSDGSEYSESIDLDPGTGVRATTMTAGLVKLDPSGGVVWTVPLTATGLNFPVRAIAAVDADQNVYLVGDFRGTIDFDPGPGVVNITSNQGGAEYSDYFAKFNSAGSLEWVRQIDGPGLSPSRLALDSAGDLVVAYNLSQPANTPPMDVDAGPGQFLVQQQSDSDLIVLKYSTNGEFVWARQFGNSEASQYGNVPTLGVSAQGDVFVSGAFKGSIDIDPGPGVHSVTNSDTTFDRYLTRLDAAGYFVWGYATEGTGQVSFRDIAIQDDGSLILAGFFTGTTDFQPGAGTMSLTSTGSSSNGVVVKLNSDLSVAWARQFGGFGAPVTDIDLDHEGNIYLGGSFNTTSVSGATADFDPGPGVYELSAPSTYETAFVLSLTGAGDFRWAVPLGGNSGLSEVEGLSVAPNGDVQISGAFGGTGDFNPDPAAETWLSSTGKNTTVFTATLTQSEPNPGAPVVDAGASQSIPINGVASLQGSVTDDGLPGPMTTLWSLVSGSGTVTFANASALDTTATFTTIGGYVLKLEATDGQYTTADYVNIVVNPLTTTLAATADTYIDSSGKTTNFGSSPNLVVYGNPDDAALLQWDLSSIPAGSTLQSATFSLNVTNTSTNTYEIYALNRSWTQSQATWKKADNGNTWQTAGALGSLDRGTTVLGTVTASALGTRTIVLNAAGLAVVQGWIDDPATNFGFVIQDYANANKDDLVFSSKEATIAADRPQLQMVYIPPSANTTVPAPRIDFFSASQGRVSVGTPITLTAIRENDPAHQPQSVSFYRDNGDGVLVVGEDALVGSTYTYLGSDYTKWIVTAETTGLAPGNYTFFAQASNASGDVQAALNVDVFGLETVNFASANVPQAIPNKTTITSTILVPDGFTIFDVDVALDITHTNDADLDVYLIAPSGTRVALFTDVGATGHNFSGTTLDDEAFATIASGTAPFTGRFRPQSSLSAFDGQNAAGVWTLEVTDDLKKNTGTLNSWSLQFTREAMPVALVRQASLQAQPAGITASPTVTESPGKTPESKSIVLSPQSHADLFANLLAGDFAETPTKSLAMTKYRLTKPTERCPPRIS